MLHDGDVTHHILTKEYAENPLHVRCDSSECVFAHLLSRDLQLTMKDVVSVNLHSVGVYFDKDEVSFYAALPNNVDASILDFDNGLPISAMEFDLEWGN